MSSVNSVAAIGMTPNLLSLVEPIQNASGAMVKLSEGLTSALGDGTKKNSFPKEVASSFFDGLYESLDETFNGFFSNVFGGGPDKGLVGLFSGGSKTDSSQGSSDQITGETEKVVSGQKKLDEERVKSDAKAWGAIVGNALLGSKKLKKIQKALSIASVVMSKAKGIARAFGDYGFPGGLVPAAIIAAKGAAQIATIKGQAHDGLKNVPSTGTYMLERGERVVGSRLNADLSEFLAIQSVGGQQAGGSSVSNVTNSPSINLTINGDAREDAVQSNRGALEGMIRDIFADYAMEAPFG